MKYVMFTHAVAGLSLPVMLPDHMSHDQVSAGKGWVPTSAGFYDVVSGTAQGHSKSLKLQSRSGDKDILDTVVAGMEAQLFLVQDCEENKEQLKTRLAVQAAAPDNNATVYLRCMKCGGMLWGNKHHSTYATADLCFTCAGFALQHVLTHCQADPAFKSQLLTRVLDYAKEKTNEPGV